MAYITKGLPNGGLTHNYQIKYEESLSQADGLNRAIDLMGVCDDDFKLMSNWFGNIPPSFTTPLTVQISPGTYASACWGGSTNPSSPCFNMPESTISLTPGNGSTLDVVRYLLVSEVTEMFMSSQKKGWYGGKFDPSGNEGSAGEALSRFLATQFLIIKGLGTKEPGFDLANSWLKSTTRTDYVNHVDFRDANIDEKTGCAILFIYYLYAQLGYDINHIIAAGPFSSGELSEVYHNLTGEAIDPFPSFKKLLDHAFPGTSTIPESSSNPDNPFPLPSVQPAIATVARNDHHVDAFWIGPDGGVGTNWWDADFNNAQWNTPFPIA
ncbi:hypothetical protein PDK32_28895, partial [Bacillus cereus]|nr:hypothetical protein [Bacillus cereus]